MQKDVKGYMYWFHLQPDYRQIWRRREPPWTTAPTSTLLRPRWA